MLRRLPLSLRFAIITDGRIFKSDAELAASKMRRVPRLENYNGSESMNIKDMIERINELAHKKKTQGLTREEQAEQKELYKRYLANIRSQLKAQLDNIEIVDEAPEKLN